jgi:hypothetical protein
LVKHGDWAVYATNIQGFWIEVEVKTAAGKYVTVTITENRPDGVTTYDWPSTMDEAGFFVAPNLKIGDVLKGVPPYMPETIVAKNLVIKSYAGSSRQALYFQFQTVEGFTAELFYDVKTGVLLEADYRILHLTLTSTSLWKASTTTPTPTQEDFHQIDLTPLLFLLGILFFKGLS